MRFFLDSCHPRKNIGGGELLAPRPPVMQASRPAPALIQDSVLVLGFMERCTPPNPQGYAGRYAPLHPAQGFLCEKALTKSAFKRGRTTRDTGEVRPPLKIPLCRGWLPRKIDSLQPREGIRVSGKISCLRRGEPLREIFRAYPLWRTDRGTGVSPANFSPIFFRQKMGPGAGRSACIAGCGGACPHKPISRWNLDKALLAGGAGAGSPRKPGLQGSPCILPVPGVQEAGTRAPRTCGVAPCKTTARWNQRKAFGRNTKWRTI